MKASTRTAPVTPSDRVSDVLARDEALVEVFVKHGPQFAKLRNRTMRRVMARLVKVEDAARMAGISSAALTGELNAALGIESGTTDPARATGEVPTAASGDTASPASRHPQHARVVEVDVREDLRMGREPFSKVIAAVGALGADEVLLLRATFEPVPLYALLEKRGLMHEASAERADDWSVWFWRPEEVDQAQDVDQTQVELRAPHPPTLLAKAKVEQPGPTAVLLDVRELEPPEPMLRTLAALETLPDGHTLVQVNVRVPRFLLPILETRGFAFAIDESQTDCVLVRITRRM